MKLVPAHVIDFKSAAERKVFAFLKECAFSPADVALHSLNIGHHEYKRWGEADFLLLTKRGILLLEVKGGRVACRNGVWEFTNRYGETNRKLESPAAQAGSALFSLEKNYLKQPFGRELSKVVVGFGVVFCDIPRLTAEEKSALPEHPDEITAYESDCRGHNTFKEFLSRAYFYWEAKKKGSPAMMDPSLIGRICSVLRPNFERMPSLDMQLRHAERELCQFTDEQYEKLDEIAENDRILISGGAGTGKTFLAVACARYEATTENSRVLLVTRSHYLKTFLSSQELPNNITVATISELAAGKLQGPWNVLIVDEGQDLCDFDSLDILGQNLDGGLEKGRWRWFGDPNRQVSPSFPLDPDSYEFVKSLAFKCNLKQNVRNSGKIVEAIANYCGADVGRPKGAVESGRVSIELATTPEQVELQLVKTLRGWLTGDGAAPRNSIVVLVDESIDPRHLANLLSGKGIRAEELSEGAVGKVKRDCVLVSRIEDFKGLERPLVCVTSLSGGPHEVATKAYKAISRANHQLVLIATPDEFSILANLALENVAGRSRSNAMS